jgi:GLPGLI family protein
MKLTKFFILIFTFCALQTSAQTNESATLRVIYKFEFILDTTQRDKIFTEDMVLFANNNMSKFYSYQKLIDDSLFDITYKEGQATGRYVSRGRYAKIKEEYYHTLVKDTFFVFDKVAGKLYLVKDDVPAIQWQMGNNHKTILGYNCTDATAKYRGRLYHVWFSPDIPVSAGPLKLYGLPGLILFAEDSTQEVKYTCKRIDNLTNINSYLVFPQNYVVTTKKDLKKYKEYAAADPIGALKANTGIDLRPANPNYTPPPQKNVKKQNNLVELPDK